MKNRWLAPLILSLAISTSASADDAAPIAQDDAGQTAYATGWSNESNGGSGFTVWNLKSATAGSGDSYAGFYIATGANNPDLKGPAKDGKAFSMFANGTAFEAAAAFRGFEAPVAVGQSVVVSWQAGPFQKKFDTDAGGNGSVGLTLRNGNQGSSPDDYNKGARFEFGIYSTTPNYQIYDGGDDHDTGVPQSDAGVKVKLTLTGSDSYDLEITTLGDQKTKTLTGRKLGGTAGDSVDSICLFDRNWEKNDAYFNQLAVLPGAAPAAGASTSPSAASSAPASPSPSASPSPAAPPSPAVSATPAGTPIPGVTPPGL